MPTTKPQLVLNFNLGFSWFHKDDIFFKGYFFYKDIFYERKEALEFLSSIKTIKELLPKINGVFTIIKKQENQIFIVSDITRSFPVFYSFTNDYWLISDDIYYIKNQLETVSFDTLAEIEFKASNHVHGSKTLLENVYQIQSSEFINIKNDKIIERDFYFSYAADSKEFNQQKNQNKLCKIAFNNAFKRTINSLQQRQVVIPLSSGLDSRLIAVMLKKYNYSNVICYTYGKTSSFEIEKSKETANKLGFTWHFIEYNENLIEEFLEDKIFKNYIEFAGKLTAMPNLQEYFAVQYLQKNNLINKDAIFIPGYAGDILGGSEYLKNIPENINHNKLSQQILKTKLINTTFSKTEKNQLKAEINKNLALFTKNDSSKITKTIFDDYNLKERIAKYIFNSASFYTFFGYEFRFPFWDNELLVFFKTLPLKYKRNKSLFDTVLQQEYFKPFNVNFENNNQNKTEKKVISKIKKQLKPILPTFIKKKKLDALDWNNYKIITKKMISYLDQRDIKIERTYNDYNEIISQWYLYISKNNLQ